MSSLALLGSVVVHGGVIFLTPNSAPAASNGTASPEMVEFVVDTPPAVPEVKPAPPEVKVHRAVISHAPSATATPAVDVPPPPPPPDPNPQPASVPGATVGGITSADGGLPVSAQAGSGSGFGVGAGNGVTAGNGPVVDIRAVLKGWVVRVGEVANRAASEDYPVAARRARMEGRVVVDLVVDAEGHVVDVKVKASSGHPELDVAAVKALRELGHVPPPPSAVAWRTRPLTFPILYRLEVR